jgi:hypothetical protein
LRTGHDVVQLAQGHLEVKGILYGVRGGLTSNRLLLHVLGFGLVGGRDYSFHTVRHDVRFYDSDNKKGSCVVIAVVGGMLLADVVVRREAPGTAATDAAEESTADPPCLPPRHITVHVNLEIHTSWLMSAMSLLDAHLEQISFCAASIAELKSGIASSRNITTNKTQLRASKDIHECFTTKP